MRKWFQQMKATGVFAKAANVLALAMVLYTANTTCVWMHHQPEVPEDVRKFRKF